MSDVYDKETRSKVMARVRAGGNKSTELKLIELFRQNGVRGWKRNYKVKGRPDFVFIESRVAVFVDGCFWHGHDCRNTRPSSNKNYWEKKLDRNKKRDVEVSSLFQRRGWSVIRIWECELKNSPDKVIARVQKELGAG